MSLYLLIETRTMRESNQVGDFLALAKTLADAGNSVDLFLIQNGVLMAYAHIERRIEELLRQPTLTVWADDFSLQSRSLSRELLGGVRVAGADMLVRLLTRPGCKPIWH